MSGVDENGMQKSGRLQVERPGWEWSDQSKEILEIYLPLLNVVHVLAGNLKGALRRHN
jgi:hypothetical protein